MSDREVIQHTLKTGAPLKMLLASIQLKNAISMGVEKGLIYRNISLVTSKRTDTYDSTLVM